MAISYTAIIATLLVDCGFNVQIILIRCHRSLWLVAVLSAYSTIGGYQAYVHQSTALQSPNLACSPSLGLIPSACRACSSLPWRRSKSIYSRHSRYRMSLKQQVILHRPVPLHNNQETTWCGASTASESLTPDGLACNNRTSMKRPAMDI